MRLRLGQIPCSSDGCHGQEASGAKAANTRGCSKEDRCGGEHPRPEEEHAVLRTLRSESLMALQALAYASA